MRLILQATIVCLVVICCNNAITLAQTMEERDKRGLDFGDLLRNLLLKSATASNVKGNIARNVVNAKTATPAPRRRTTTTTTTIAPLFVKGPFRFPFDLSNYGPVNKFNPTNNFKSGGFINFDYNDYGAQRPVRPARRRRPTTTTTTTTTTTQAPPPAPTRRRPLQPIRYGRFGQQKLVNFDYYDDDYDYNYDDDTAPASETPAPAPPPPPSPRPRRPPTANRARVQGRLPQLRTQLVYQYRQPDDTSTNNGNGNANAAPANNANEDPNNNQETSANTNDYNDDDTVANTNDANASAADPNDNVEDYNDASDNANANVNADNANADNVDNTANANFNPNNPSPNPPPPLSNFNPQFNAASGFDGNRVQAQFDVAGPGSNNFGASAGFQYPNFNDFSTQYQSYSPTAYSTRYY